MKSSCHINGLDFLYWFGNRSRRYEEKLFVGKRLLTMREYKLVRRRRAERGSLKRRKFRFQLAVRSEKLFTLLQLSHFLAKSNLILILYRVAFEFPTFTPKYFRLQISSLSYL